MNGKVVPDGLVAGESPRRHDGGLRAADWAVHKLITLGAGRIRPASILCHAGWPPDRRPLPEPGARSASAG